MSRSWLVGVAVAAVVGACRPTAPPVTPEAARWAIARWPDTTAAQLDRGRSLYMHKCSGCHRPPSPFDHAPDDWPREVAEMRERSHLLPEEVTLIERYVVTVATRR